MTPVVSPPIGVIMLELAGIILVARLFAALARRFGQPAVVGEIIAGLLLGKSVFDRIGSGITATLWPSDAVPSLKVLAAVGLALYMFVVGVEVDLDLIRGRERAAATISLGSIVVPFTGGILLSLWLFSQHDTGKGFLAFALFVGAAMSITAFPVLARILTERGMHRTELGGMTLASAAVDDVVAWVLLAGVVIIADRGADDQWHLLLIVPYLAVMFFAVRPALRVLITSYERSGSLQPWHLATVLIGAFSSAWCTDWLGIHYIFGAFLFGAVMPRAGATALLRDVVSRIEQVSMILLLPVFFIVTGLSVDVFAIHANQLLELLAILGVAIGGKFIGAFVGARLCRIRPRRAGAVAVLMNTRGLTELVILTVGHDKKILDDNLFALLVLMAIITTVMTGPMLRRVYPDRWVARDVADAERRRLGAPEAYRVVVAVKDAAAADPAVDAAVDLAVDIVGGQRPAEIVLTSVLPYQAVRMEVGNGLRRELLEVMSLGASLDRLATRITDVPTTVLTRLGDDVAGELCAQLIGIDAHVVILVGDGPVARAVSTQAVAQVVVVTDPGAVSRTPIVARHAGPDVDGAIEVALRLSLAREVPLILTGSGSRRRRTTAIAEQLTRAGVDVTAADDSGHAATAVVITGPIDGDAYASMVVRSEHDRRPTDWHELASRLSAAKTTV